MKNKLMKLRGKITVIMMNMITCFLMAQNHVYAVVLEVLNYLLELKACLMI